MFFKSHTWLSRKNRDKMNHALVISSFNSRQTCHCCSSVTQSCLTLQPNGLQHTRLPGPSPSPGACSNSCPLSQSCHPAIPSSVIPFCLQSFPVSGSFPMSWLFTSSGQSIGASVSASVLPTSIQGWFPLGLTGLILQSKGSQVDLRFLFANIIFRTFALKLTKEIVLQFFSCILYQIWELMQVRQKTCWFDLWVGKIPWRREWQPTPVFLSGEPHGQRGLVGYSR